MAQVTRIKVEPGVWFRVTDRGDQKRDGKPGLYEIAYRDAEGTQRRKKVAGGLMAAKKKLREAQTKRDKGERETANPRLRFKDAAQAYVDMELSSKAAGTIVQRKSLIANHLLPRFGNRKMGQITADDAAKVVTDMREKDYSEGTINPTMMVLSLIFKYAQRRLGGPPNPVAELLPGERAKPGKTRKRIYVGDQMKETIAAAHQPYRMMCQLGSVTGARLGEVIGLHWGSLKDGVVSIRGQVTNESWPHFTEVTKTPASIREVPIPSELWDLLMRFKEERAFEGFNVADDAFVFSTRASGLPLKENEVWKRLRQAQKDARTPTGAPTFPVLHADRKVKRGELPSFHSFRHMAASHYIDAGMQIEVVADILGDTVNTLLTTYRQAIDDRKRRQTRTETMAAVFADILEL